MKLAPPPEKPKSLRLKKPCFEKWRDYELEFSTDPKMRKRKPASVIRDETPLVELGRKKCKKVVSLSDFNQNNSNIDGKLETPLTLNDDLVVPKQPRCVFQRKKVGTSASNLPNNNDSKLKEVISLDKGKVGRLSGKGHSNGRNLRPKNQYGVTFVKRRRRFYEVFSGDIDPYWIVKQRIQIFWPLDEKWYFGVVKAYNLESKKHHIKYDDHDEEWVDLQKERFKLLIYPTEIKNRNFKENAELKISIEEKPVGSRVFGKSTKASGRLSQTMISKKKDVFVVYVRRRRHKGKVDNLPKLMWHISLKRSLLSWLLNLPHFSVYGKLVLVWQTVRLEIAVIDNFIGLRIFSFEGHLKGAVDLLCFIISRFCQKKVVRRNREVESERKQPCTSMGIKISGLHVRTTELYWLTYRFHEFGVLELGLIESRMRKRNCFRERKLSVANFTHANLRKISSSNDLLFPSLSDDSSESLLEDIGYQSMPIHSMDSPVVLFYHIKSQSHHPSLFLSTHLKLLKERRTSASPVSSSLAWNKTHLSSVSPTSVLTMNGFTPRSKKRRTAFSHSPEAIYDNHFSSNKSHIRKHQSWENSNNFEIPQIHTRPAPVKTIPTPSAHFIDEPDELCSEVKYVRDSTKYHREVRTEVERALESAHVVYDMDCSDEEWFKNYNCDTLSEDIFEQMLDSFEKLAYIKKSGELTAAELEEIASKYEHKDFISDVYEYWHRKRQKTGLPLIRQFQPPLWEVYQKQMHQWELATSRLCTSSPHDLSDKTCLEQKEKPAPFAFCLKPRGLDFLNKGAKPRPHKKFLTKGSHCCSSPRELDAVLYAFGKKSCEPFSPHAHGPSNNSFPRNILTASLKNHVNKELFNTRKHHGIIQSPRRWLVEASMSEFKSYDASAAAAHAAKIAKLKREKAQLLFQKADLALYKAACAHVIADAIEKCGTEVTGKS